MPVKPEEVVRGESSMFLLVLPKTSMSLYNTWAMGKRDDSFSSPEEFTKDSALHGDVQIDEK